MKTGIVKFSKEFVTPIGTKEWVGLEMEYDMNTECPRDVLTNAKTIVEQWHKEANPVMHLNMGFDNPTQIGPSTELPVINKEPEEIRIGVFMQDILSCNDLETIDSYRLLVKGKPELEEAYKQRRKEIVAQESKEILDTTETLSLLIKESGLPYESLNSTDNAIN